MSSGLEINRLSKQYGAFQALNQLSFSVTSGEIFGLIGPDGAGKTTALRMVCGLLTPSSGGIRVCGVDPTAEPRRARRHIGYMPQRFSLYPDLTVAENLRFFVDLYGVPPTERRDLTRELMRFSRLEPFINRRAGLLSGGMKQKLALMCSLIHKPQVLILDEPTTGVDPVSRAEFWSLLRQLAAGGAAILASTPYMDEAGRCDRIALLYQGRTIATGTPEEITGSFPYKLLEVQGGEVEAARRSLLGDERLRQQVLRFGDRLHIVCRDAGQMDFTKDKLQPLKVTVDEVPATIEDVFIALMGQ